MLILSRRQDEKIVFPNLGITIDVCKIRGSSVQLGVNAPSEVRVLRHELAESLGELTSDM
jgi:carbon storage regulator CsrA